MTIPILSCVAAMTAAAVLFRIAWLFHRVNKRIDRVETELNKLAEALIVFLEPTVVHLPPCWKRKDDADGTPTE
jgi:hypothetical protein